MSEKATEPELPATEKPEAEKPGPEPEARSEETPRGRDPVVRATRIVLGLCAAIFAWYVLADRITPATDQARIRGLVVPVVPQVSGYLTEVNVHLHSAVSPREALFQLDPRPFELAARAAQAQLEQAIQQVGAQGASVQSAVARVGVAKAQLDRAQRSYDRTIRVLEDNPGALSQADRDRTETSLAQSVERVASADADLEKARQQLGLEGADNPQIRGALAALERAQLDLEFSTIRAPSRGFIESFNVDIGHYAQKGQPLATFVSTSDVWIQADMRENNLGRIETGNRVEISLDVAPGRVFHGAVRSVGYGVDVDGSTNRGELPSVASSQGWLRDPQRFPVIIGFDEGEARGLKRAGGQVNVVVYTGTHPILNTIAWIRIRLTSLLSYVR